MQAFVSTRKGGVGLSIQKTCEQEAFGPVQDQVNQSRLDIYLINFQPLWDRSQIKLHKLFNAQNGQIIA